MSEKLNTAITVIGIDIGKNSFHVVGLDKRGAIALGGGGEVGRPPPGSPLAGSPPVTRNAEIDPGIMTPRHDAASHHQESNQLSHYRGVGVGRWGAPSGITFGRLPRYP
jgi:hypothetical protein